ncbi:hypothetical protein Tco_0988397 [Tanacetum coccineum]|uniref:Uncharacterized protein n=1 Tax=Tanacetum coccineum TaxID=301880 RepID=A0ABQ5ERK2_9ASTR
MVTKGKDIVAEFCGPSRLKELSKESGSRVSPLFKEILKGVGLDSSERSRGNEHYVFATTGIGVGSKRYHVVTCGELDGIPIALVARFGVVS